MVFSLGGGLSFLFSSSFIIFSSVFLTFVSFQLKFPFTEPSLLPLSTISLSLSVHIIFQFFTSVYCLVSHHLDTDGESELCKHISAAPVAAVDLPHCETSHLSDCPHVGRHRVRSASFSLWLKRASECETAESEEKTEQCWEKINQKEEYRLEVSVGVVQTDVKKQQQTRKNQHRNEQIMTTIN